MIKMKCKKCGECCKRYPCALEPKDLKRISNFLNITKKELIKKYLILDYWVESTGSLYLYSPKRITDNNDRIASFSWAFSSDPCIFLENNLCKIHDVKPRGGREYICGIENTYSKYEAGVLWKENKYLKVNK